MLEGLSDLIGTLQEKVGGGLQYVQTFIKEKPLQTASIGTAIVGATALGTAVVVARKRKKTTSKSKKKRGRKKTSRGRKRDWKFRSKQKHELAYVRRKRKAGKKITRPRYKSKKKTKKKVGKIYYTKNGQPYKILRSGKARFIKGKRRTKR